MIDRGRGVGKDKGIKIREKHRVEEHITNEEKIKCNQDRNNRKSKKQLTKTDTHTTRRL